MGDALMHGRRIAAAAVAGVLMAGSAWAQSAGAGEDPRHEELRGLKTRMEQALNRADIDALLAEVTDDIVFTTMNGDRVVGKTAIRGYFEKMMKGPQPQVASIQAKFEADALSHLYANGEVAIGFGSSNDRYRLAGGDTFTVNPKWSATMLRQDDRWRIASFHYSTNMFDNPVLEAQRGILVKGGIGVAVVCALAGFALGWRARGRRAP